MKYLTAKEVAERRRRTEAALAKERDRGQGPPYVKDNGRILYPEDALNDYLEDRLVTGQEAS